MGRARLRVAVERRPAGVDATDVVTVGGERVIPGADGFDQVEVLLAARPGAPELPVTRGASGGELSRVMLALEVALAGADPVGTLVFDEVDAGVGGRAATEIGRRLAALALSHQVIVVTHLAQVAAFATRHYVVDADADGIVGASAVRRVDGLDREAELARMLGRHRRVDGPRTCRGTARRRGARSLVRSNPNSRPTAIQGRDTRRSLRRVPLENAAPPGTIAL